MVCSIAIAIVKANQAHKAKKTTDGDGMQRIHFHAVNNAIIPYIPYIPHAAHATRHSEDRGIDPMTMPSDSRRIPRGLNPMTVVSLHLDTPSALCCASVENPAIEIELGKFEESIHAQAWRILAQTKCVRTGLLTDALVVRVRGVRQDPSILAHVQNSAAWARKLGVGDSIERIHEHGHLVVVQQTSTYFVFTVCQIR